MCEDDVGYGVIHPLVLDGVGELREAAPSGGSAMLVAAVPALLAAEDVAGDAAAGVHGYGGVAARVPELDPANEGRAAAAMDEDDAGDLLAGLVRGDAVVREYARGLAPVGEAFVEDRLH